MKRECFHVNCDTAPTGHRFVKSMYNLLKKRHICNRTNKRAAPLPPTHTAGPSQLRVDMHRTVVYWLVTHVSAMYLSVTLQVVSELVTSSQPRYGALVSRVKYAHSNTFDPYTSLVMPCIPRHIRLRKLVPLSSLPQLLIPTPFLYMPSIFLSPFSQLSPSSPSNISKHGSVIWAGWGLKQILSL